MTCSTNLSLRTGGANCQQLWSVVVRYLRFWVRLCISIWHQCLCICICTWLAPPTSVLGRVVPMIVKGSSSSPSVYFYLASVSLYLYLYMTCSTTERCQQPWRVAARYPQQCKKLWQASTSRRDTSHNQRKQSCKETPKSLEPWLGSQAAVC